MALDWMLKSRFAVAAGVEGLLLGRLHVTKHEKRAMLGFGVSFKGMQVWLTHFNNQLHWGFLMD